MTGWTKTVIAAMLLSLFLPSIAEANGEIHEVNYSVDAAVRWLVIALGGLIGISGVFLTALNIGKLASIDLSIEKKTLSMKQISQGIVITIVGAAVLIATLYFLPDKTNERTLKAKVFEFQKIEPTAGQPPTSHPPLPPPDTAMH